MDLPPQGYTDFRLGPQRRRRFTRAEKEEGVALMNRGWSCRRVARHLGCSPSTPIRWRQEMRRGRGWLQWFRPRVPPAPPVQPRPPPPPPMLVPFGPLPEPQNDPAALDEDNCVIV